MDKNQSIKEFQNNQKYIGSNYYSLANECSNPNLRIDFLAFAREESEIITWLNYEFDSNSIPNKEYASEEYVKEAYEKYSNNV